MAHARTKAIVEPLLLDVEQAAEVLNDGVGHIRELMKSGELDTIRDGRRTRTTMESCKRRVAKLLANTPPSQPLVATPTGKKHLERLRREKTSA